MDIYYPKDNAVSHGKVHELLDPEGALRKGEHLTEESIRWLLELHGEMFLIEQHYSVRTRLRRLALNGTPVAEFPDTEPMVDFSLGTNKIRMGFTVKEKGILYELFVNGRRFEELTQALPSPIASCAEGSGMTFGEPVMFQRLGLLPPHIKEAMVSPVLDTSSSSQRSTTRASDLLDYTDVLGNTLPYNSELAPPDLGLGMEADEAFGLGLGLGTLSGALGASYAGDAGTSSFVSPPPAIQPPSSQATKQQDMVAPIIETNSKATPMQVQTTGKRQGDSGGSMGAGNAHGAGVLGRSSLGQYSSDDDGEQGSEFFYNEGAEGEEEEDELVMPCFKRGRSMPAVERLRLRLPSTGSMSDLKSAAGLLRPPMLQKSLSTSDVMERPPKLKIVVPAPSAQAPCPPMCRPR